MLSRQQLQTVQLLTDTVVRELSAYPGYAITDTGRIFSCQRSNIPHELFGSTTPNGYRRLFLRVNGKRVPIFLHRLVALAFLPPPPFPNAIVRHLDGNPANNHVSNLAWGTPQDNSDDMKRHGTSVKGTRNGVAKLSDEQVQQVRQQLAHGVPLRAIGRQFGVSRTAIWHIKHGISWTHVS